jgi:integrase
MLELGAQVARQCPTCKRARRYWSEQGAPEHCPNCGGNLQVMVARRQIVPPDRYATKKEAQTRLTTELNASLGGTFVEPAKLSVAEFLEKEWLPTIKGTVKETTEVAYQLHVGKRLIPQIGSILLQKLTTRDIDLMFARLQSEPGPRGKPLSPASCRAVGSCLKRALAAAVKWNLIARNPALGSQTPRVRRPDITTWTREVLALFLSLQEGEPLYPLWRVLAATGMRRGEALGLRIEDLDLDAGRLGIRHSRTQAGYKAVEQGTKTGKARVVALDTDTIAALRQQIQQQLDDAGKWGSGWTATGHVFTREDGTPWQPDRISKLWDQAVAATGVKRIRLHDLRHTHATIMLQAGVHPKVVSERLGHSKIGTTLDLYSHVIPALEESAAELFASLLTAAPAVEAAKA